MRITDYFSAIKRSDTLQYANIYELVIGMLLSKKSEIRVLELGSTECFNQFGEGSINSFCNMPFVSEYVGIDRNPPKFELPSKATMLCGDIYSEDMITTLKASGKTYDLIIEDGSHHFSDQLFFFKYYSQFCSEFSVMVCEDIPTFAIRDLYHQIGDSSILCVAVDHKKKKDILYPIANILEDGRAYPCKSNCFVKVNL